MMFNCILIDQYLSTVLSSAYGPMIAILSLSCLSIIYLGTEPSLFRLPASQTRFINFEERYKEFQELETTIRKKSNATDYGRNQYFAMLHIEKKKKLFSVKKKKTILEKKID